MKGKCPTCKKPYEIQTLSDLPTFPFCSPRCRLIDLGRWIDEEHSIPASTARDEKTLAEVDEEE